MPKPRPPHLHRQIDRHGNVVWYVRVGHGPRIRIRPPQGTPEFEVQYQAALSGERADGARNNPQSGSLAWLWDQYRQTGAWTNKLKPSTCRLHENVMRPVLAAAGNPFGSLYYETNYGSGKMAI